MLFKKNKIINAKVLGVKTCLLEKRNFSLFNLLITLNSAVFFSGNGRQEMRRKYLPGTTRNTFFRGSFCEHLFKFPWIVVLRNFSTTASVDGRKREPTGGPGSYWQNFFSVPSYLTKWLNNCFSFSIHFHFQFIFNFHFQFLWQKLQRNCTDAVAFFLHL